MPEFVLTFIISSTYNELSEIVYAAMGGSLGTRCMVGMVAQDNIKHGLTEHEFIAECRQAYQEARTGMVANWRNS